VAGLAHTVARSRSGEDSIGNCILYSYSRVGPDHLADQLGCVGCEGIECFSSYPMGFLLDGLPYWSVGVSWPARLSSSDALLELRRNLRGFGAALVCEQS
jgi:hypothetical protein